MSTATIPDAPPAVTMPRTVGDVLELLKDIPPSRIFIEPPPGAATEQDLINAVGRDGRLRELVDGVLVEKVTGYYESVLAGLLCHFLWQYLDEHDLGFVAGEAGLVRPIPGQVRMPDVAFYAWTRFDSRLLPRGPILDRTPDLAVEILSPTNTKGEMDRKRGEYFAGGARLVWQVDPDTRRVRAYTGVDQFGEVGEDAILTGGAVLPGFTLSVRRWFERAGPREE